MKHLQSLPILEQDIAEIAATLSGIAQRYHLDMESCSEERDLTAYNIQHAKCIDSELISRLSGKPLDIMKDRNQREACGCAPSIDIGAYNANTKEVVRLVRAGFAGGKTSELAPIIVCPATQTSIKLWLGRTVCFTMSTLHYCWLLYKVRFKKEKSQ